MSTPDITKAQIVAVVQPFVALAISFGVPVTDAQQVAILTAAGAVSSVLVMADALIRYGRSRLLVAEKSGAIPQDSYEA